MAATNNKLRICIIMGGHFSARVGGAQYQAKCIVDQLVEEDCYEIFYLARVVNPDYVSEGYKLIKISDNTGIRKYGFVFDVFQLNKYLNEIGPDVIYQRGLKAYTGIAAYYAKNNNCRMIFHVAHDDDVCPLKALKGLSLRNALDLIEKRIGEYGLRRADAVIAQTKYQAALLQEHYALSDTLVIRNFHPQPLESLVKSLPVKVVWVANFKPTKQPEIFVWLAKELQSLENVEFHMIGRPGDSRLYSGLHEVINGIEKLTYYGEKSIEFVNELLSKADIFVNTSLSEGFPNTFIQAWMRKVPVVSLSVDPDNVLQEEEIGFFSGSREIMREKIVELVQNHSLRKLMGERAFCYANAKHSVNNVKDLISIINHK